MQEVDERESPPPLSECIRRFLETCREPAMLEAGDEPLALPPGNYAIEVRSGRTLFQAWDERRNIARRITRIKQQKPGRLELICERFGKKEGELLLIDLGRAERQAVERKGARLAFRERFRKFVLRQFPGWMISELSTEANLEASLSPVYPRALIQKGAAAWAVIGAPPDTEAANGVLTFGLIWLEHLRLRREKRTVTGLVLFLPERQQLSTCLRLRFLDSAAAQFEVFVYADDGFEDHLDPANFGNLDTSLDQCRSGGGARSTQIDDWVKRLLQSPELDRVVTADGSLSLRVHGLEIARATQTDLLFGMGLKRPASQLSIPEIESLIAHVAARRSAAASDREHPLYRGHPECWLESQVRRHIEEIDSSLLPTPVYGQVPAFAGGDRGILDLLAVDRGGRLAVLELKASEDIHLPLQALDYWMRVKWHVDRDDFRAHGYFPGIELRNEAPRLLLVAPALDFHPKTEAILRYFAPEVQVERIGVAVEWRKGPKVMFRIPGSGRPL